MKFIFKLAKRFKTEKSQKLFFIGIICLLSVLLGFACSYIRISVDTFTINKIIIIMLITCEAFALVGYIIAINAFDRYEYIEKR